MEGTDMTIELTREQIYILIESMRDRIRELWEMSEAYKKGGNREAQLDCLYEKKRVQILLDKFMTL